MSNDLVERLRHQNGGYALPLLLDEAADEIERLRGELQTVANVLDDTGGEFWMPTAEMEHPDGFPILKSMRRQPGGNDE